MLLGTSRPILIRCSTEDTEEALIWGTIYSYGTKLSVSSRKVKLAMTPQFAVLCLTNVQRPFSAAENSCLHLKLDGSLNPTVLPHILPTYILVKA